jgi:hypothetical protein
MTMRTYRVWLQSEPGMWEHYAGYVDVVAEHDCQAEEAARDQLKGGAFPERPRHSWIVEQVEPVEARADGDG